MQQIQTIGIDLAKNVFQVHGVDESHEVVLVRQLRRNQVVPFFEKLQPCLVGMEACATAHHWARELMKLGHNVRLIPPVYVKAYVKRSKNDAVMQPRSAKPSPDRRCGLCQSKQKSSRRHWRCIARVTCSCASARS